MKRTVSRELIEIIIPKASVDKLPNQKSIIDKFKTSNVTSDQAIT